MKKMMLGLSVLALVLGGCSSGGNKEKVNVYSWGAYIDTDVIAEFENKYNVVVNYETFDSNESMYTRLKSGEVYDVLIPSDYMIQRLIAEDALQTIDYSKLSNYGGVVESLKVTEFDPGNKYSVPYFWGNVGILYNKDKVALSELEAKGWNILRDSTYANNIFMYNSERDSFMVALKSLGYSMNSTNPAELEAAYNWLVEQKKQTLPIYGGDEIIDSMISGVKAMAVMYSGDASYIIASNPSMDYYVPEEGTNIWLDSMVIPKDAQNVDLAHKWIDYMLDPEVAYKNTVSAGYTSSVQSVIDKAVSSEGEYFEISSYVPRTGNPKDEEFHYNASVVELTSGYWSKVLAAK